MTHLSDLLDNAGIPEELKEKIKRIIKAAIYSVYLPDAGGYCTKEGYSAGPSCEDVWEELRDAVEDFTGIEQKDGRDGWMTEDELESMLAAQEEAPPIMHIQV